MGEPLSFFVPLLASFEEQPFLAWQHLTNAHQPIIMSRKMVKFTVVVCCCCMLALDRAWHVDERSFFLGGWAAPPSSDSSLVEASMEWPYYMQEQADKLNQ